MLTAQAIEDFKNFISQTISYAKVTISGTTQKMVIKRKERLKNGQVAAYIEITPQARKSVTVQRVQLYNNDNQLWADKTVSIPIETVQKGVLYRFTFDIKETEV